MIGTTDREYTRTHPWLTFQFRLDRLPAEVWILLGEVRSKCDHIAGVPLRKATADQLHRVFLAKGVLGTTAIEGNTLSEEEVLQLIDGKLQLPPSREYLAREIENILVACNDLLEQIASSKDPDPLCVDLVKRFNRQVLDGLELPDGVVAGHVRSHSVIVANYRGAPPQDCEYLLGRMCDWLNGEGFAGLSTQPDMGIVAAVIKSVLAHLYLAWIHPFGDGNGRTARLVEFHTLVAAGVPTPAAHLLSNHYNQTRTQYYRHLAESSKIPNGNPIPFLRYALQGFVDGLRDQLQLIREQQWDVAWRNFVFQAFRDRNSGSDLRRRRLVLDLSRHDEQPVPRQQLATLTPRLAQAYAGKTDKTISRDLNALAGMGLLRQVPGKGWVSAKEQILAFLPIRRAKNEREEARKKGS